MWNFVQTWNPTCFRKCDPSVSPSNQFALNSFVIEAPTRWAGMIFALPAEDVAWAVANFSHPRSLQPNAGAFLETRIKAAAAHDSSPIVFHRESAEARTTAAFRGHALESLNSGASRSRALDDHRRLQLRATDHGIDTRA
jgi:hypothetical protein